MAYTSLLDVHDDVLAVQAKAVTALTLTAAALALGAPTGAQLGACASSLTLARVDIRTIRASLDTTDVAACQVYDDAAVTIALWGWERGMRAALSTTERALQAGSAGVAELLSGVRETYHTVRRGDTLQSIAAAYLGSWAEWPRICAANDIKAGPVAVGTVLVIPQKV